MAKAIKKIAVTGGAGNIANSLLFRIASGEMLGPDQPIALHILEIPRAVGALEGVCMELEDCAFPLLKEVKVGGDPMEIFGDVDYAMLVGAMPRGLGMERQDLLEANGKIFVPQGKALNAVASRDCKVLVVGNPCNTNCLIAMHNAPDLPRENFMSMTHLDHNRALAQLAAKAKVPVGDVTRVAVWGNHSLSQVPDWRHALIHGKPIKETINDKDWLENSFVPRVQKRGAEVIAARGKSSAASAANAAIDAIVNITTPTPEGDWFSCGVCSDSNPYGFEENLIFSMPCRSPGDGSYEVMGDLPISENLRNKILKTQEELIAERDLVADMLL